MQQPQDIILRSLSIGYTRGRHASAVAPPLTAVAPAARLTCIIGRNGAGKSTLLRTVARLQPALGGSVALGPDDITAMPPARLARAMAIVLTRRPDARALTVEQLVALGRSPYTGFWGRLSPDDRAAVERAMDETGITALAARRVCSLSDGECQKAMIAKALAQDTPCILLDEPTAFLDFPGKVELMLMLRRLARRRGKTVLLSTHDLETALQTADRLWLLSDGGITQGEPRQLVRDGHIARYICRDDVTLDPTTMAITIARKE